MVPGPPTLAAPQGTAFNRIPIHALPAVQMAAPAHQLPPTPPGVSVASTGAVAFQSWLADEEEEWRLSQRLEASCPKEFKCPISLDIMQDPIILVRPMHHTAQRLGVLCWSSSPVPHGTVQEPQWMHRHVEDMWANGWS